MHTQTVECQACGRILKGYQPAKSRWPDEVLEPGYTWIMPFRHKAGPDAWWAVPGEWCVGSSQAHYVGKDITV